MYIGLAEYYSEELSQKILRGLNESRKKGFYCGGGVPYGYKVVARKIVEDCDKADIVRYIFSQYAPRRVRADHHQSLDGTRSLP